MNKLSKNTEDGKGKKKIEMEKFHMTARVTKVAIQIKDKTRTCRRIYSSLG